MSAEEKATGIVPDQLKELENLLGQVIALEESAKAGQQETGPENSQKIESHRANDGDIRLNAKETIE